MNHHEQCSLSIIINKNNIIKKNIINNNIINNNITINNTIIIISTNAKRAQT